MSRARAGIPALGAGCVLVVGALAWPYTVDDAFIVARYARHIAAGQGYAMNPGQPSDGVTGPLWLLPGVTAAWARADPVIASKALGLVCAASAAWLVLLRLRRRALGGMSSLAACFVLACSPSLATWAVSGLESGTATLLATIAALCAGARPRVASIGLGLSIALLAWLRPELALFAGVLLAFAALRDRRAFAIASSLAGIGALAVIGFRWVAFDRVLPLAWSAKAGSFEHGVGYVLSAVLLASSGAGAFIAYVGARRGRSDDRAFGLALLAQLGAIVLAGGDWMPGYRLLVPLLPLYAWLVGVGVARLALQRPKLAIALVGAACAIPALDLGTRLPELRASARSREQAAAFAAWLRSRAPRVALVDVGFLAYAGGFEVIDLGGLTDPRIAGLPGGHLAKRIPEAELLWRAPDAIVLHSASAPHVSGRGALLDLEGFEVERRIARMRFVRERFRVERIVRYAPRYLYVALVRVPAAARADPERTAQRFATAYLAR